MICLLCNKEITSWKHLRSHKLELREYKSILSDFNAFLTGKCYSPKTRYYLALVGTSYTLVTKYNSDLLRKSAVLKLNYPRMYHLFESTEQVMDSKFNKVSGDRYIVPNSRLDEIIEFTAKYYKLVDTVDGLLISPTIKSTTYHIRTIDPLFTTKVLSIPGSKLVGDSILLTNMKKDEFTRMQLEHNGD